MEDIAVNMRERERKHLDANMQIYVYLSRVTGLCLAWNAQQFYLTVFRLFSEFVRNV